MTAETFTESLLNNMSLEEKARYELLVAAEDVRDQEWLVEDANKDGYQDGWYGCLFKIMSLLGEIGDKPRKPAVLARWLRRYAEMDD